VSTDRRSFLTAVALAPAALAQTQRDWSGQAPVRYADPDVIALDKRFEKYRINNTTIQRLWTGALWAEGTAWNGAGRYLRHPNTAALAGGRRTYQRLPPLGVLARDLAPLEIEGVAIAWCASSRMAPPR
jgi:hypothetical protein